MKKNTQLFTKFRCCKLINQNDCHHDPKVKPEAATAVIGLLMMGGENAPKHVKP
jgi:hypothetical protein